MLDRHIIISKVFNKLAFKKTNSTEVEPTDHKYEVPKIPKDLQQPTSKRDVEYLKFIKKLVTLVSLDPMTGVYNKQHFEKLKKEPGVYLCVDGDGIKKVNTEFGHEAGHAAILALSSGIKSVLRSRDDSKISWFGGDEFTVHIKDVPIATGVNIAKRMIESINKQKISAHFKGKEDIKEKLDKITLGASIGVGNTEEEADKALYKAKEKGRNRVEFFSVNKNK